MGGCYLNTMIKTFKINNAVDKVNEIIEKAIDLLASDIHIRNIENNVFLEYRVQGELLKFEISNEFVIDEIIARLKVLAKLNVAEKRMPQDGSFCV